MTGPGNDIIALKTIDPLRSRDSRFYSKISSPAEQQLYQSHFTNIPFELFLWLLWSVKESVYKCLQRDQPALVFSPVRTEIIRLIPPSQPLAIDFSGGEYETIGFTDAECFCSEIRFNSQTLYARSVIYADEFIATVALSAPDFSRVAWGIRQIEHNDPDHQSAEVRKFLLKRLAALLPDQELHIEKNASGCPLVFANGVESNVRISLSHHDRYAGYCLI